MPGGPVRARRTYATKGDHPEAEVLRMVLESYLSDLRMEIANTDSMDYREMLKARKMVLRKVVSMMTEARSTGAP